MQTVGLTWTQAAGTAVTLAAVGSGLALSRHPRVRAIGALAREMAVIASLYGLWRLAGLLSVRGSLAAVRRAEQIDRLERTLHLPSERSLQHVVLEHPLVIQAANLYYDAMHLTTMLTFLLWLFVRHRDRYRPVRMVLGWTTLGCLLIQMIPVAPPRMLPGFIDTALIYHQSVYANGFRFDQMSAMPSIHVAWATLVGITVWRVSPSRWRLIGPAHTAVTVLVVVVTGNHWWLDGIVAVAVLATAAAAVYGIRAGWRRRWAPSGPGASAEPMADPVSVGPAR